VYKRQIIERFPHPRPVSYVPIGRDATIAGDYLDLKFANNTDNPIYISSCVEGKTLLIRFFGHKQAPNQTINITTNKTVIEPKVVMVHDDSLKEGESKIKYPGQVGYEVHVYREVIENGRVIERNLVSSDYYTPLDKIVLVGSKINQEPAFDSK